MSLVSPVKLDLLGSTSFRLSHDHAGTDIQKPFEWPLGPEQENLAEPGTLPPKRAWKVFSTENISAPLTVHYPERGRKLEIEYTSEEAVDAYWGMWINSGGWAGHRHFAVEPTTGRFDQLDRAIKDQSAGKVGPSSAAAGASAGR
jgi:hypothetical protein